MRNTHECWLILDCKNVYLYDFAYLLPPQWKSTQFFAIRVEKFIQIHVNFRIFNNKVSAISCCACWTLHKLIRRLQFFRCIPFIYFHLGLLYFAWTYGLKSVQIHLSTHLTTQANTWFHTFASGSHIKRRNKKKHLELNEFIK